MVVRRRRPRRTFGCASTPTTTAERGRTDRRWAAALRQQGLAGDLSLDTYHPESGRDGDGRAGRRATLFAADSAAALTQLRAQPEHQVNRHVLTAASMDRPGSRDARQPHRRHAKWPVAHRSRSRRHLSIGICCARRSPLTRPSCQIRSSRHAERPGSAARHAEHCPPFAAHSPYSALTSLLHLHFVRTHGP